MAVVAIQSIIASGSGMSPARAASHQTGVNVVKKAPPTSRPTSLASCSCSSAAKYHHQPITILLISVADLALFRAWSDCRDVQVEHGSDGARILTLMAMAKRFEEEQAAIDRLRSESKRTQYVETMYILDLALDKRTAPLPCKPVPWGRYEDVLEEFGLE